MNKLLILLTIILLLGCDNQTRADNDVIPIIPNFHYVEGYASNGRLTPLVYHDDSRHTTCYVMWQGYGAPGTVAMTCIPDWQLDKPKQ